MALPNLINVNAITGSSAPSTIDNDINNFKQAILDIFGMANNTFVNNAAFDIQAGGLNKAIFANTGANPSSAGQLQRNTQMLKFHNGTSVVTLMTREETQTISGALTYTNGTLDFMAGGLMTLGTSDAFALAVKTNNTVRMSVSSTGVFCLKNNVTTTGAAGGDTILANNTTHRWMNAAGSTSANFGIKGDTSDHIFYDVPTNSRHTFAVAGTPMVQINTSATGPGLTLLAESSTDHGNPVANAAVLYLTDNGAGKTQLKVRFATGAAVVIATQP
jgi:hypothetical protein